MFLLVNYFELVCYVAFDYYHLDTICIRDIFFESKCIELFLCLHELFAYLFEGLPIVPTLLAKRDIRIIRIVVFELFRNFYHCVIVSACLAGVKRLFT